MRIEHVRDNHNRITGNRICIGVPVMNQHEETKRFLRFVMYNTARIDEIVFVDNGSTEPLASALSSEEFDQITPLIKIIRNESNVGVRPALNQILKATDCDIIVFTHNDVNIYQIGWDNVIRQAFVDVPDAGVVGPYGAKGIGSHDIYKVPYVLNQLGRFGNVSNARMDKSVHGFRNLVSKYEDVVVFDGFMMAIRRDFLESIGGFSDILPQHHNYDNLICIQSIENGYRNIVIPLDVTHLGGRTDVNEDWNKGMGKEKQEIHSDAHVAMYNYCKGTLPLEIVDIYNVKAELVGAELLSAGSLIKRILY